MRPPPTPPSASAPVKKGPPTIGFLGRFATGLLASGAMTVLACAAYAGAAVGGWAPLVWVFVGEPALIASVLASATCALLPSWGTRSGALPSIANGVLSVGVAIVLMLGASPDFGLVALESSPFYLAGGVLMGLAVGVASEASRKPLPPPLRDAPARTERVDGGR